MTFKDSSIKLKLTFIIVATSIILTTIALLIVSFLDIKMKRDDLVNNGVLQAKLISQYVEVALDFNDTTWANHVINKLSNIPDVIECNIYKKDGSIFAKYVIDSSATDIDIDIDSTENITYTKNSFFIKEYVTQDNEKIGTVLVRYSSKRLNDTKLFIFATIIITLLLITIFGYLFAIRVQKLISKPIIDLANSMENIDINKEYWIPNYESKDEIGILYNKFSQMLNTISESSREVKRTKSYLNNIIDSMPSILVGIDVDGTITSINKTAEKRYEIRRQDIIGKNVQDIFTEYKDIIDNIIVSLKSGMYFSQNGIKERYKDKDMIVNISAYPLVATDTQGAVIRIDDVTREHKMEQELSQTRKMDAIGQLAGGVAHDFNNMLGGIMGAAELLDLELEDQPENITTLLKLILSTTDRASDLTKKLLAFGRKGKIASTAIDINSILNDTIAILKRSINKKIAISCINEANNNFVVGDNSALQNAFMNLGINAGHAMESNGGNELTYTTRNTILSPEYCEISPFDIEPGEYIEIEVRDKGTGISEENLKNIFEPFFTTKEEGKGTGLGLAAVYGTVTDHHGAITVYSELGVGTVFHIFLPVEKTQANTVSNNKANNIEIRENRSGKILLVDDEDIIRISGKLMLEKMGYEVILANNGLEAVKIFKKEHNTIDVVISDMIMPKMNGSEAFYKLKEIDPNCSIIIASGFTKDTSLNQLKKDGLKGFLNKPYRLNELSELLNSIIN